MDFIDIGYKLALYFVPFLFALCFHEFAHAWVAKLKGDNTAELAGRLTLNPVVHADLVGTYILPISSLLFQLPISFGWAKPVPVNERNLKHPTADMFWIALAGPFSNIFLALLATIVLGLFLRYFGQADSMRAIVEVIKTFVGINLFLAVFNLIPIHPLDGGKVLARFLPADVNYKLEQNAHISSIILLVLVFSGILKYLAIPVYYMHRELMAVALRMAS